MLICAYNTTLYPHIHADVINVHNYEIKIHTHLDDKVPRFNGRTRIDFYVSQQLNYLLLNAHSLNISFVAFLNSKVSIVLNSYIIKIF